MTVSQRLGRQVDPLEVRLVIGLLLDERRAVLVLLRAAGERGVRCEGLRVLEAGEVPASRIGGSCDAVGRGALPVRWIEAVPVDTGCRCKVPVVVLEPGAGTHSSGQRRYRDRGRGDKRKACQKAQASCAACPQTTQKCPHSFHPPS